MSAAERPTDKAAAPDGGAIGASGVDGCPIGFHESRLTQSTVQASRVIVFEAARPVSPSVYGKMESWIPGVLAAATAPQ